MDCGGYRRIPHAVQGGPTAMSPRSFWRRLAPQLQTPCVQEIKLIVKETVDEHIRTRASASSVPPGGHLHSPVQPTTSAHPSGESAPATRVATAGRATRLVAAQP